MPRSITASSDNYYVTTTSSSQIKVWQIESVPHTKNTFGKLLTELCEPNHLNIHYTSIAILDDDQIAKNQCLLALGDKVGRIVLFDIKKSTKILEISNHTKDTAKTFKHIKTPRYSRVNSVSFDANELIMCSSDKKMRRFDLNGQLLDEISLGDKIPSCLTITHAFDNKKKKKNDRYLVVGCNNIDVYNITNKQKQQYCIGSLQGHASQVRHLHLTDDNNYLISAAQDRFVYIWKCKPFWKSAKKLLQNGLKNDKKAAMFALPLDDDIVSIDIRTLSVAVTDNEKKLIAQRQENSKKNNKKSKKKQKEAQTHKNVYYIAAASKSSIYIWCFDPLQCSMINKNGTTTTKPNNKSLKPVVKMTIARTPKNGTHEETDYSYSWIRHIQFIDAHRLMILRGTASIAVLKQVQYSVVKDDDDEFDAAIAFVPEIVLENVSISSLTDMDKVDVSTGNVFEAEKNAVIDEHLTVLDCGDSTLPNVKSMNEYVSMNGNGKIDSKKRKRDDDYKEPPTKKAKMQNGNTTHSLTFAEKLFEIERKTEENKNKNHLMNIPTADSLAALLTQSLQANDQTMFENLLSMQDDEAMHDFEGDMIKKTLDRIPSSLAVQLLEKLTAKFRVSPRQSIWILRWLLPLLNSHSASFAKNLASRKHLISIHQAIDYQIKSLLPAMKLQGRLSLLMGQMQKVHDFAGNNDTQSQKGAEMARYQPLFVHDETLELNEESFGNNNKKSSDNINSNNKDYIKL